MARVRVSDKGTTVDLTRADTEAWAKHWPCSTLAGRSLWAVFEANGDLVESNVPVDVPADEFNAITSDTLRDAGYPDHPAIRI